MDTASFTFDRRLYRDKGTNRLTFEPGPRRPLAIREGITLTLESLAGFMSRYGPVDASRLETLFAPDVLSEIRGKGIVMEGPPAADLAPAPAPEEAPAPSEPEPPAVEEERPAASEKMRAHREEMRARVFDRVHSEAGITAFIEGRFDEAVKDLVSDLCEDVFPRQVLANIGQTPDRVDRTMDTTLSSQAIGSQLDFSREDLFVLAKSAMLNSLSEVERENIGVIKRNLLSAKPSQSFRRRLEHYYREVHSYLTSRGVDSALIDTIDRSIFVYFDDPKHDLPSQALALGIADAFVTLKEGGSKTLGILEILPARLRQVLGADAGQHVRAMERLLRESCYNEYRRPIDDGLSGGDHCGFFHVGPGQFGILIFDVSGHGARASKLRDALVTLLDRIRDKSKPGVLATRINNFLLQNNCPEDMFVSFLYGIVDLEENRFHYTNAGHTPPYRVHEERVMRLERAGDLLLNIAPIEYQTHSIPLANGDNLVFYTDGLTEAQGGDGQLFGEERLQDAIGSRDVGRMRTRDVIRTILGCVRDEGFEVRDDITIQVYRHV
ncbi:MAG: serine/threonine-protein phosphatase [Planctomycetes bacterium]|nr:serine/threonine-protein phosphatase [Planctomycetota bacterium]